MTTISRRSLLASTLALPLLPLRSAQAAIEGPLPTVPSIHRFVIGDIQVAAISDGYIDAGFGAFTGLPEQEVATLFRRRFAQRSDLARLGFTVWLVNEGRTLTLIDAGSGGVISPTSGYLTDALELLDVDPGDIDQILITHMHADHIGGLLKKDRRRFRRSKLFFPSGDVAHFGDAERAAAAPDHLKGSFQAARQVLDLYSSYEAVNPEMQLTSAITAVDLSGHTPGHTGYRITSGSQSLLIVGDALFDPALHPARTDVGIAFEADPKAASAMRRKLFPALATSSELVAATHMPFPGIGRVVREGKGLRWLPADWGY